jgi:hypothetical protein
MSCPSPRTVAPPPRLPLGIKDSLKKYTGFLDEGLMRRFFDEGLMGEVMDGRVFFLMGVN